MSFDLSRSSALEPDGAAGGRAGAGRGRAPATKRSRASRSTPTPGWIPRGWSATVSLKKQGAGNTGNGGLRGSRHYQYVTLGKTQTVVASAPEYADGGFGYFVGHERYRSFADGDVNTIAGKSSAGTTSPLGRGFPATISALRRASRRWRSIAPRSHIPATGRWRRTDMTPTVWISRGCRRTRPNTRSHDAGDDPLDLRGRPGLSAHSHARRLSAFGPGQTSFDVRGSLRRPGVRRRAEPCDFEGRWGDRYHFASSGKPFNRSSAWTWNLGNQGGRYNALVAGAFEMGLFEPRTFQTSALRERLVGLARQDLLDRRVRGRLRWRGRAGSCRATGSGRISRCSTACRATRSTRRPSRRCPGVRSPTTARARRLTPPGTPRPRARPSSDTGLQGGAIRRVPRARPRDHCRTDEDRRESCDDDLRDRHALTASAATNPLFHRRRPSPA